MKAQELAIQQTSKEFINIQKDGGKKTPEE